MNSLFPDLSSTLVGGTSGFVDGSPSFARFSQLNAIVIDAQGMMYVSDGPNNKYIRRITPSGT